MRAEKLKTKVRPLTKKIRKPKPVWLKPKLLVDVEYRALTGTGKLRHPSFKGVLQDTNVTLWALSGRRATPAFRVKSDMRCLYRTTSNRQPVVFRIHVAHMVSRHWPIKWQLLSSLISRTNKLRSIPVTVRHSMDCPFESPIKATPIGVITEIFPFSTSASVG